MLNDFTWNMTGYIPKHQVNPHGDGIIPYFAIISIDDHIRFNVSCY